MIKDEERKLSAIMFTDMVGYSALAQEDEGLSLELLEEHRKILRPLFIRHDGHEVETAGDAFFVEFSSALAAVNCAIDIQKTLVEHNKDLPSKKHIKIRIGIHLGDVVHRGRDVLGDGVNIAARIEPLARSCGICVSEDVARQVQNKIKYSLKKIETTQLKNIKLNVGVYAVELDWLEETQDTPPPKKNKPFILYLSAFLLVLLMASIVFFVLPQYLPDDENNSEKIKWENSIAVLPFTDLSPQKDQEYFCVGMTEQILTNLAKLNKLKVIARTSVMKFQNHVLTIPEIASELDVKNVLEGSIRKSGSRLRITAQLLKGEDGSHIWAEDYDREFTELFAIQDEISRAIADKLYEELTTKEVNKIKTQRPVNLEAYEYFLKGEYLHRNKFWASSTVNDFESSEKMFLKAIELDPDYAQSYAGLVDLYNSYWNKNILNDEDMNKYLELQEKYIRIAFELDSTSADVIRVMGWVYGARNEVEKEIEYMKRAIRLAPNDPENMQALGICYDVLGLKYLALKCYNRCIELDPLQAKYYHHQAGVKFSLGNLIEAWEGSKKSLDLEPNNPKFLSMYIWILFQMEEISEAENLLSQYINLFPETENSRFLQAVQFALNGQKNQALAINILPEHKAIIYLCLKMSDEVIALSKQFVDDLVNAKRSHYLIQKHHPLNDFIRPDPRFQKIMQEHKKVYEENLRKYGDGDIVLN